jgi:hypothetical protein
MPVCGRCKGERYEEWEEDGRWVRDACYHCGNTGEIDEQLAWRDRLTAVAETLAYLEEDEYRDACNADPDGENYTFRAAENMMSPWDYFKVRVWDRTDRIRENLASLPIPDLELLVAWNELPADPPKPKPEPATLPKRAPVMVTGDDDIPF